MTKQVQIPQTLETGGKKKKNNSSVLLPEIGINAPLIRSKAVSSLELCSLCGAVNSTGLSIVERMRDMRGSL